MSKCLLKFNGLIFENVSIVNSNKIKQMTKNYILNREPITLKKTVEVPVTFKNGMLHNIENYSFKIEHALPSDLKLLFNFSNADGTKSLKAKGEIKNNQPFYLTHMDGEEVHSYGMVNITGDYDTTIALTIESVEGGFGH